MSRIIVKNLPRGIPEEKLKDKLKNQFSKCGLITDIQLKYAKDGRFRQFCFIGYQTEAEGQKAIQEFNNSCINTNKITVEVCALLGDQNKLKAWSKHTKKNLDNVKKFDIKTDEKEPNNKPNYTTQLLEKYKSDPKFEEFLDVHDAKAFKELLRKEDDKDNKKDSERVNEHDDEEQNNNDEEDTDERLANKSISDLEYMKQLMVKKVTVKEPKAKKVLFCAKLKNLPIAVTKKDVKEFLGFKVQSIRVPKKIGIGYVGVEDEKVFKKLLAKDKSILGGKKVQVTKYTIKSENDDETPDTQNAKWLAQEESLNNEETIAESGQIFLRNLSYTTTEDDIQKLFEKYGPISEISLPIDIFTRQNKGFGVVTFLMPEDAVKAYSELSGNIFHGRMLHLLPAKAKQSYDQVEEEETSNFKKAKAKKQKEESKSSHNWNSLFLGQDAVATVVADTYGTTKENVLNPFGSGAAVRLALGETQIVATTKKYLEERGVVLDAFNNLQCKRSKTIILVKNLPGNTEAKEVIDKFKNFGEIGRFIFPPSGITAIVEFIEPSEARKAFKSLAYTRFKNMPLYLEWAPETALSTAPVQVVDKSNIENKKEDNETVVKEEEEEKEVPLDDEKDTTLFVRNVNFITTDDDLRKHFETCGKVVYANIAMKKDFKNANNMLSMGYGFVRFATKEATNKALINLQSSLLHDKTLELKRSERASNADVATNRKTSQVTAPSGTKFLVRNVPFQAKLKELYELFRTFGELKTIRLPKKQTVGEGDSHRGFCFVDYVTESDAKTAFEAVSQSTHLYGRRLVLEWVKSEDTVDDIRKRTAEQFYEGNASKKNKKIVFD